ncbi:MAG: hypothetical protein H0W19_05185 [Nitrosopumilus sp.]|nr:hypothetical protein [Nitrosopumilus sp.]
MSEVNMLSAVTLIVKDMDKSCSFYSHIPGFKLIYGGSLVDSFTTYQIGKFKNITFLNLQLKKSLDDDLNESNTKNHFGRIIFYTNNVDRLYTYFKTNKSISNLILIENEPVNDVLNVNYSIIVKVDNRN